MSSPKTPIIPTPTPTMTTNPTPLMSTTTIPLPPPTPTLTHALSAYLGSAITSNGTDVSSTSTPPPPTTITIIITPGDTAPTATMTVSSPSMSSKADATETTSTSPSNWVLDEKDSEYLAEPWIVFSDGAVDLPLARFQLALAAIKFEQETGVSSGLTKDGAMFVPGVDISPAATVDETAAEKDVAPDRDEGVEGILQAMDRIKDILHSQGKSVGKMASIMGKRCHHADDNENDHGIGALDQAMNSIKIILKTEGKSLDDMATIVGMRLHRMQSSTTVITTAEAEDSAPLPRPPSLRQRRQQHPIRGADANHGHSPTEAEDGVPSVAHQDSESTDGETEDDGAKSNLPQSKVTLITKETGANDREDGYPANAEGLHRTTLAGGDAADDQQSEGALLEEIRVDETLPVVEEARPTDNVNAEIAGTSNLTAEPFNGTVKEDLIHTERFIRADTDATHIWGGGETLEANHEPQVLNNRTVNNKEKDSNIHQATDKSVDHDNLSVKTLMGSLINLRGKLKAIRTKTSEQIEPPHVPSNTNTPGNSNQDNTKQLPSKTYSASEKSCKSDGTPLQIPVTGDGEIRASYSAAGSSTIGERRHDHSAAQQTTKSDCNSDQTHTSQEERGSKPSQVEAPIDSCDTVLTEKEPETRTLQDLNTAVDNQVQVSASSAYSKHPPPSCQWGRSTAGLTDEKANQELESSEVTSAQGATEEAAEKSTMLEDDKTEIEQVAVSCSSAHGATDPEEKFESFNASTNSEKAKETFADATGPTTETATTASNKGKGVSHADVSLSALRFGNPADRPHIQVLTRSEQEEKMRGWNALPAMLVKEGNERRALSMQTCLLEKGQQALETRGTAQKSGSRPKNTHHLSAKETDYIYRVDRSLLQLETILLRRGWSIASMRRKMASTPAPVYPRRPQYPNNQTTFNDRPATQGSATQRPRHGHWNQRTGSNLQRPSQSSAGHRRSPLTQASEANAIPELTTSMHETGGGVAKNVVGEPKDEPYQMEHVDSEQVDLDIVEMGSTTMTLYGPEQATTGSSFQEHTVAKEPSESAPVNSDTNEHVDIPLDFKQQGDKDVSQKERMESSRKGRSPETAATTSNSAEVKPEDDDKEGTVDVGEVGGIGVEKVETGSEVTQTEVSSSGAELQRNEFEKGTIEAAVSGSSDRDGRDPAIATEQESGGDAEVEVDKEKEEKKSIGQGGGICEGVRQLISDFQATGNWNDFFRLHSTRVSTMI